MPMPPIEFHVSMFRGDWDQARSQYVLLFMMEALCRVNQSLIRQAESMHKRGMIPAPLPKLYRSGVHYEREKPNQEEWPDIIHILQKTGQTYPGSWGDCEDLACWRVAELREQDFHIDAQGNRVEGGMKAKPFAKWRRGPNGNYNYHALVLLPDGRLEDPSLVLGMGREKQFSEQRLAEKYKRGELTPEIQYAASPEVMVVDPDKPGGFGDRTDPEGVVGPEAEVIKDSRFDDLLRPARTARIPGRERGSKETFVFGQDPVPAEREMVTTPDPITREDLMQVMNRLARIEKQYGMPAQPLPYPISFAKRSITSEAMRIMRNILEGRGFVS